METIKINLNDRIRFKIAPRGREYIANIEGKAPGSVPSTLKLRGHLNGWIEMQIWEFSYIFGPTFVMGPESAVDMDVEILKS